MKKLVRFPLYLMLAVLPAGMFVACSDSDPEEGIYSEKDEALLPIVEQYVNKTVIPTYTKLSDATIDLTEALAALQENKTDANVEAVSKAWKEARTHWELSEAFLFGAASDFGIDPHIDTWPLDITSLRNVLANKGYLESMAEEDGDVWAGEHLGSALLGFHGIEYIIYSDGQIKKAADITDDELIYSVAVAGDLRNRCVQLEVSWAGDKASQAKQDLIEELEFPITASNSQFSYGENMLNAGLPGSTYRTVRAAAAQILDGAFVIADEVGNIKIGNAASGDDVNYIESPFSHNSLTDFIDNVKSIENAFYGGAYGDRNNSKSLSAYLMKVNPGVEKAVADAITASYAAINAIPAPFVNNYADPKADEAVIVVGETLARALTAAQTVISEE